MSLDDSLVSTTRPGLRRPSRDPAAGRGVPTTRCQDPETEAFPSLKGLGWSRQEAEWSRK